MADQSSKDLLLKDSYASWLQLIIAALVSLGSFLAWAESKYVSKEVYNTEISSLHDLMRQQTGKLDDIYHILLERKRKE